MDQKIVYLMRGLPACGKSFTARKLAAESGTVLETDEYFYAHAGTDPGHYDYSDDLLPAARQWNFERFVRAIAAGITPIVVDRGNGLNPETVQYARYAIEHNYRVELAEPESEWWQELRVLLKYKEYTMPLLDRFADELAHKTRDEHRVPAKTIRRWMKKWKWDLTVEEILEFDEAT